LLIKINAEANIFIIGQETFGGWTANSVSLCQDNYRKILDMCLNKDGPMDKYLRRTYNSIFWKTVRKIISELNIDKDNVAWNNINRMDYMGGSPNNGVKRDMLKFFPLLPLEVKILNPKIIIFFSGSRYDDKLKEIFGKIHFQKINGIREDKLAKITISNFNGLAYRTYHPAYKPAGEVKKIISIIKTDYLANK
jgi:hypothetical protein